MSQYRETVHLPPKHSCVGNIFLACMIAKAFARGRSVTPQSLMQRFGMSRATAYRWTRAWREANGQIFDNAA